MQPRGQRIGQLLGGKYRVQQLLAVGGMGVVYGAHHELTGRAVAIKVLRPELALRPDLTRRVAMEARLAVEASHPNVVEVLDAGADEAGVPYLVLERLYGRPLEALITERLSLLATAQALLPVMNALAALHRAGIVHRDIKPSNIFLSCEGDRVVPKLLDFGIAKALAAEDSTLSNVALGTPSYMAPEQALGCTTLGPPTDVWSMGVVFVRCLINRLPFAGLLERGPSALSFGFRPEQLEHVPESVGQVLARALQLDPGERFASMAEFRRELSTALSKVDAREAWPDEASVGYPLSELALASALERSLAGALRAEGDARPARPHDMVTRTFSKLWQTARQRRWSRLALGAPLLIGAGAFVAWKGAQLGTRSPLQPPLPDAIAASPERPWVEPIQIGVAEDGARSALDALGSASHDASGNEAPAALPSITADTESRSVAKAPAARPQKRPRAPEPVQPKPLAPEPDPVELTAEATLGPNRAPIIE